MAYLTLEQLGAMGFKAVGQNVKISDKAALYQPEEMEIGDNSRIDDFCVLSGKIYLGRNVHIAIFCNVAGGTEGVTMEDFSGLAYGCQVFTQSDDYTGGTLTNPTVPTQYKRETKKPIVIGRHSIIGANSVIFPGVVIAEGCAIGAMSLVAKSTEAWSVYFGIPARRLAARSRDLLELERRYLASENENNSS